ncbi:MAG TPA: prepilin-type N-terminal cleavage/methylation domain-containing protein [Thermoanaerobaculia bacterium]
MRRPKARRAERGYNLIELLIAMALLGTILLSIVTLFAFGRRNVYSGKQLTRATSVTTQVLEDLQPLNVATFNTQFKITSTEKPAKFTVGGVTYDKALVRSTADLTKQETTGPKYLTRWNDLIPASKMAQGKVTLVILPDQMFTVDDPTTAAVVRLRVVTEWREESRTRYVTADAVKFNRAF